MITILDEETIRMNSQYKDLIPMLEDAFTAYYNGNVDMPDKSYVNIEEHNGDFRSMPAYINSENWEASGVKWVNVHPDNTELPTVMGTVTYTDPMTGEPLAVINGTELTKRRTAAVSALATKHLAAEDSTTLGILGAGVQAYEQVRAIQEVRDINVLYVSDIDSEAVESFKQEFSDSFTVLEKTPSELTSADILCTTTPTTDPIIDEVLNESIHINAMGADASGKQELNSEITTADDLYLIVDSYTQAIHSGEINVPMSAGILTRDKINGTLSDVIVDSSVSVQDTKTLFDSTGLAIQDIAAAHLIYKNVVNH